MPKRLHGNIEIDLRRFGLPAQSGPVHVAFDNAGRPLRAELTVPGVLWNTLTEPGHGSAKSRSKRRSGGESSTGMLCWPLRAATCTG